MPGIASLVCLGGFRNERSSIPLVLSIVDAAGRRQEVRTIWEVDRTDFEPGPVEYELEVELPSSARDLAISAESFHAAVEARLAELGVPWCPQPESKYARFRRYVLGRES